MLIVSVALIGCNSDEKVKITFKAGEYSSIVEINKGTIITENIIPLIEYKNKKVYQSLQKFIKILKAYWKNILNRKE